MSIVEVRVPNLDCEGCATRLKKALHKLKGVEEIEVDMDTQKVTVRGYGLEERKVLKAVKRAGKAVEPWPYPSHPRHFAASFYKYPSYIVDHFYDSSSSSSSKGIAPSVHAFFRTPAVYSVAVGSDEVAASFFSDDNPHACVVM